MKLSALITILMFLSVSSLVAMQQEQSDTLTLILEERLEKFRVAFTNAVNEARDLLQRERQPCSDHELRVAHANIMMMGGGLRYFVERVLGEGDPYKPRPLGAPDMINAHEAIAVIEQLNRRIDAYETVCSERVRKSIEQTLVFLWRIPLRPLAY